MGPLPDGADFISVLCDDVYMQSIKFPKISSCILQLPTPTWLMDEILDGQEGLTFKSNDLQSLRKLLRESEDWKSLHHLTVGIEGKSILPNHKSGLYCKIKFKCTSTGCNSSGFFYSEQKTSLFLCARIEGNLNIVCLYLYVSITSLISVTDVHE